MKSQKVKLYDLLEDGQPHRTDEILEAVYGASHLGIARIASRVYDLKKDGFLIQSWPDEATPSLTWYKLIHKNLNGVPIQSHQ